MKRSLLGFLFVITFVTANASHIVGGEFEMLSLGSYRYRFHLIIYFDEINGDPGNKTQDATITARIFRYSDNEVMRDVLFQFQIDSLVNYTNQECAIGELVTSRMIYVARTAVNGPSEIFLDPNIYNDPQGYYIIWERCCRNYDITNIHSDQPPLGGGSPTAAGQTFFLQFPPVIKGGVPFINSSPRLFPPLSDYGCPGNPYYTDFAGTDDDGDSLVYSIVTPLNTHATVPYPPLNPKPFPLVLWKFGYSIENIMDGSPDLKISQDGLLTVTPTRVGLFVFAVRCDEYRDGIKIGEVRRDFQMLVVGACPESYPPNISGKGPGDTNYAAQLTVSYDNTVDINDRCFEIKVADHDAETIDDNNLEKIWVRAIPIGFKRSNLNSEIMPVVTTGTVTNNDSISFEICFRNICPYTKSGFFDIGIIASDDACVQPRADTFYVSVYIEPPPNQRPQFLNDDEITEVVQEGSPLHTWPLEVSDPDGNLISYRLAPVGFSLEDFGMSFSGPLIGSVPGPITRTLSWDPKCDVYDFTQKSTFELYFIAEDQDICSINSADTTYLTLSIADFSQITPPIIDNSLINFADTLEVTMQMYGDPLLIDVSGTDVDNTNILLRGNGVGFSAPAYGISFPGDFDQGSVASQFKWELECDSINLGRKNEFEFMLMVVDSLNKCGFYKADTLHLFVTIEPPEEEEFNPPNVFTPNDDDVNAFFGMFEYNENTGEFVSILPEDNCFGKFVSIRIYDRWGKHVYESHDRNFKWKGEDMPVGVYYYYMQYTNRNYKGIVSLRL